MGQRGIEVNATRKMPRADGEKKGPDTSSEQKRSLNGENRAIASLGAKVVKTERRDRAERPGKDREDKKAPMNAVTERKKNVSEKGGRGRPLEETKAIPGYQT